MNSTEEQAKTKTPPKKETKQKKRKRKKAKLLSFRYFLHDFVKVTGGISVLIGLRPKRYFVSKKARKAVKGAALIVGNHLGYLDPIRMYIALWYRRIHILATDELFRTKFANWFFRGVLAIPINTQNPGLKPFNEAVERLKEGSVVGVFPEGHVNRTEAPMQDFKSGVILMAMRSGAPIIPVYFKPWEHWYNRNKMVIGEPIDLKELTGGERMTVEELEKAAQLLQERVEELKNYLK